MVDSSVRLSPLRLSLRGIFTRDNGTPGPPLRISDRADQLG